MADLPGSEAADYTSRGSETQLRRGQEAVFCMRNGLRVRCVGDTAHSVKFQEGFGMCTVCVREKDGAVGFWVCSLDMVA